MRLSRSPRTKRRTRVVILVHCVGRGCGSWNVPRPEFWGGRAIQVMFSGMSLCLCALNKASGPGVPLGQALRPRAFRNSRTLVVGPLVVFRPSIDRDLLRGLP